MSLLKYEQMQYKTFRSKINVRNKSKKTLILKFSTINICEDTAGRDRGEGETKGGRRDVT